MRRRLRASVAGWLAVVGVAASALAAGRAAAPRRPARLESGPYPVPQQQQLVTPPPPVVTLPPGESPAQLRRMEVRVAVSGLEAETVTTMTFRNPNGRPLAGDFEFPLPGGAVVAGYALDLNGRMVDGVLVSRDKARVVLETETRRRVDPGLVEHVRGNVFRTRIFPLPARGERTVRVVTVGPLTLSGGDAALHVPLPRLAVPALAIHVEVAKGGSTPRLGGFGNLSLTEWSDRWVADAQLDAVTPGDDLYIRLPKLPTLLTAVEELDGERYVAISDAPTLPQRGPAPAVGRVAVAWDASGSRSPAAVRRDRALLAALVATPGWRQTTIDLVVFRDRPEPVRRFSVRDGQAADLLSFLDAVPYDGGTDLGALDLRKEAAPHPADEAWLLFTDGLYTLGVGVPSFGGLPVHVIGSDSQRDQGVQRLIAAGTGGTLVDLSAVDPPAAARLLADPPVTLLRVDAPANVLAGVQYRFVPGSGRASVYARLLRAGEAALVYGVGGREVQRVPVRMAVDGARAGRLLARAWAARRVEELAVFPDRNEAAMMALGRRFGLVTPSTSLIVLETVQQYVEHEIEPPATWPEMRQQYYAALDMRKGVLRQQRSAKIDQVLAWWRERVAWWEREFQYAKDFKWKGQAGQPSAAEGHAAGDAPRQVREAALSTAPVAAPPPVRVGGNIRGAEGGVPGGVVGGVVGGLRENAALKVEDKAGPVAAGIAVRPWSPDTPYLKAIKAVPASRAYATYLEHRRTLADSPSFFLDCAGALLPVDKGLGMRVLSNLAELRIDDAALLRVFAWRLVEAGALDRAVETLERVRGLRPEDPQSHRDLALALADRMDHDRKAADGVRAARLLYDVVLGTWQRFEQVEVIALMELNRILARLHRVDPAAAHKVDFVDERLRTLLDVDVRIVMSWDADNTDIDLHVVEPSGEEAFYGHNTTTIGGHVSRDFTDGYGPEEYVVRRALPGVYKIRCKYYGSRQQTLVGPASVTATVITNFGREDERRQVLTLRLQEVKDMVDIGEVTIGAATIDR